MRTRLFVGTVSLLAVLALGAWVPATARPAAEVGGAWSLSLDRTGSNCRVLLRAQKTDGGNYFLGMPVACRHTMPALAGIGRWSMPDDDHLVLSDPSGASVLTLSRTLVGDDTYATTTADGGYTMRKLAPAPQVGFSTLDTDGTPDQAPGALVPVATHKRATQEAPAEPTAETTGRYAVMRGAHDTGCMLTLDSARVSGGSRAQLAPGCRDQGIVVFDPSSWALVKGQLVLTARAGHKAHLAKGGEGAWTKDAAEGGKPLGLKKL